MKIVERLRPTESWRYERTANGFAIYDENGVRICNVLTSATISTDRALMYAQLIKSAPDLLRSLPGLGEGA